MEILRVEIKALAQGQIRLKQQRKTVNFTGDRKVNPQEAADLHGYNRYRLRIMYMALGLLRGKEQQQIESNPKTSINMDQVKKLMEIHRDEIVRAGQE